MLIAGTNGKGSTATLLESIARSAGLTTGLYTSPHFLRYNERIRINGVEASDPCLCRQFCRIEQARGEIPLTYFEYGTLAALLCFAEAQPDLLLLEVGLGGRLDAVNLVDADLAIVTTVGLDHTDWLGSDRNQIGREKAGIMREGKPALCGDADPPEALLAHAGRCMSLCWFAVGITGVSTRASTGAGRGGMSRAQSGAMRGCPCPPCRWSMR